MWQELGLTKWDWACILPAARGVLVSLRHQLRLADIRCTAYATEIAALRQQLAAVDDLRAEIAELRERLGQTSRNSSRPPSSDPRSRAPRSASTPTGRRRGAQPGHRGHGRTLRPTEEVDHRVELRPVRCAQCGQVLLGEDPHPWRHQVSDVLRVKAEVTEYRRHTLRCVRCGTKTAAEWPAGMPRGRFGPQAQAAVAYLSGRLGASHRDVSEAMGVLHGLEMSLGSVSAMQRQVSDALAEPVAAAQQFVQQQKAQYVDETAWYEGERQKWLWVNATADVTVFSVLDGRSATQAKQVISPSAKGIITTDRHGAYTWLAPRRRQLCWAHLKRDFQALVDRGGDSAEIGQALLEHVERTFTLWHQVRAGALNRRAFASGMKPIQ